MAACAPPTVTLPSGNDAVAGTRITFNDNGGWCWYQDERALVDTANGKFIIGSVASGGSRDSDQEVVVVNIATQSGTNKLKGNSAMAFTPRSWNGDNTPTGTSAINAIFQVDAALGGPIKTDHAWFYGPQDLLRDPVDEIVTEGFRAAGEIEMSKHPCFHEIRP